MRLARISCAIALTFFGNFVASAVIAERSSTDRLLAYGGGGAIDGLPIFFSDGLAYVGTVVPKDSVSNSNISFTQSDTRSMLVSAANSNVTTTNTSVYINTLATAFAPVGFTSNTSSTTATTTGFLYFGSYLMWKSASTGSISSLFYATPTEQKGLYQLKWNSASVSDGNSVAVTIKKASI